MAILNTTESAVFTVLRAFLLSILPAGVEAIKGQDNRVGEPVGSDFVVMTPTGRKRLSSNVVGYTDNAFIGSIAGTTLTVDTIERGALAVGYQVWGVNVAANTIVTAFGSGTGGGTGGVGTYTVSVAQNVSGETMRTGTANALQSTQISIQLDVHGPTSGDNAQLISSLFFDQYAFGFISAEGAAQGIDIAPLYCSDPVQTPFIDAEQQYENKYVIDMQLQINTIVQTPIQFATVLGPVNVIDVDVVYPAS